MKKLLWIMPALMVLAACGGNSAGERERTEADRLIDDAHHARNYTRLFNLADSLQQAGSISLAKAYYWQGYACDHLRHRRTAEFYWKAAVDEAAQYADAENLTYYAKAASYLANALGVRGDYESTMKMAEPVVARLEELQCDTTSDYTNLLVFIGCCQSHFGRSEEVYNAYFDRAYEMHQEFIRKDPSDEVFKNAIAGVVNMAYNCIDTRHYYDALTWINHYGKLISQFETRGQEQAGYVDKQWARYDIYRAIALEGLGRSDEAASEYSNYQRTQFSQTPEGHIDAADFLSAAERWGEAADSYSMLDAIFDQYQLDYSLENIQKMALRKYRANTLAGRRDSATAVAVQICDSLDDAILRARKLDAEEQAIIHEKEQQIVDQQKKLSSQRILALVGTLALVILFFGAYVLYRRKSAHRLSRAHEELKTAYSQLKDTTSAKERIDSELRIAHKIQMAMLPATYPDRDDIQLCGSLTAAKEIGGDLYDFFIRDEKLFFCIGDVSGRGVPAALVMTTTKAQFRTIAAHESMPSRIVAAINSAMAEGNDSLMFVTLFVGVLDLTTGRLRYTNAGHDAALLIGSGVGLLPVDSNIPVGLRSDWQYTDQESLIDPGTIIFLYTNGLTEAENATHAFFSKRRMMAEALQSLRAGDSPEGVIVRMKNAVSRFVAQAVQSDDTAMLAIRYQRLADDGIHYQRSLSLPNDVEQMPRLARFVDDVSMAMHFDEDTMSSLNMALEQAVTVVMTHAYPQGTKGDVHIEAHADSQQLRFLVRYNGQPFDPTAPSVGPSAAATVPSGSSAGSITPSAGSSTPAAVVPGASSAGSLAGSAAPALPLVQRHMDAVSYEYSGRQNLLTLVKNLPHTL